METNPGWVDQVKILYIKTQYFQENDLAILVLDRPTNFSSTISPICLPREGDLDSLMEESLWVTGWGKTSIRSGSSDTLQELEVDTETGNSCTPSHLRKTWKSICWCGW